MDNPIDHWLESNSTQRLFTRWTVVLSAELAAHRHAWPCLILDISPRGAGLRTARYDRLVVGERSQLRLHEFGVISSEVRHVDASFVGLMFEQDGLRDADMVRWLELLHVG